jgi:phosphomannomutase
MPTDVQGNGKAPCKLWSGHRFHPTILREYDIRGIVDRTLFQVDAFAIGRAYATILREKTDGDSR